MLFVTNIVECQEMAPHKYHGKLELLVAIWRLFFLKPMNPARNSVDMRREKPNRDLCFRDAKLRYEA